MKLKDLRGSAGITQGEFAKLIGVSQRSIASYENGTRTPRPGVLIRIADYFGVTVDDLLREPATNEPAPATPVKRHRRTRAPTSYHRSDGDGAEAITDQQGWKDME